MSRAGGILAAVAVLGLFPWGAAQAGDLAADAKRAAEVRKKLEATIDFPGIDDPDTKFGEGLAFLSRIAGVTFEINEQAFKDVMIDDVSNKPLGRDVPKMAGVPLEKVLRRILARIPAWSGATFIVRGGVVEITTRYTASPSNWRSGEERVPLPPEVSFAFDKRELREALQEIADATGVNIVLDTHAQDKGKTPVSATIRDVAVDTAVQLLANMADLQVVAIENVLCVAPKEAARELRKEQEKRRRAEAIAAEIAASHGLQSLPRPIQPEAERLLRERDDQIRRLKEKLKRRQQPEVMPKTDQ